MNKFIKSLKFHLLRWSFYLENNVIFVKSPRYYQRVYISGKELHVGHDFDNEAILKFKRLPKKYVLKLILDFIAAGNTYNEGFTYNYLHKWWEINKNNICIGGFEADVISTTLSQLFEYEQNCINSGRDINEPDYHIKKIFNKIWDTKSMSK